MFLMIFLDFFTHLFDSFFGTTPTEANLPHNDEKLHSGRNPNTSRRNATKRHTQEEEKEEEYEMAPSWGLSQTRAPKELLIALLCFKIRRASGLERAQIPLVPLLPRTISFFLASSFFLLAPSLLLSHARTWAPLAGAPAAESRPTGRYPFGPSRLKIPPWTDFFDLWHLLKSS